MSKNSTTIYKDFNNGLKIWLNLSFIIIHDIYDSSQINFLMVVENQLFPLKDVSTNFTSEQIYYPITVFFLFENDFIWKALSCQGFYFHNFSI